MRARALVLASSLAAPLVLSAPPAVALDAGSVSGQGHVAPGLQTLPIEVVWEFSGTSTTYGTNGLPATFACSWNGHGLADNVASGVGTMSGSCGPLQFVGCAYVRSGAAMSVGCQNGATAALTFTFMPPAVFTLTGSITVP